MEEATCVAEGCARPAASRRGMCSMHYQRVWKQERRCSIKGCERPYAAKQMCSLHYKRQRSGMSFDIAPLGHGKASGCAVDGCTAPYHGNGYCSLHAQRVRRTGDPLSEPSPAQEQCTVAGCEKPHSGKGYCIGHYKIVQRHGSAEPQIACRWCGAPFLRPMGKKGSYHYCSDCMGEAAPHAWAALRRRRLEANNAEMSGLDRREAVAYREILHCDPCVFCGAPSEAVDHIQSVVDGGSDHWWNLAAICHSCNSTKRDRSLLGMLLARR